MILIREAKIKFIYSTSFFSSGIEHSFWEKLVIEAGSGATKAWGLEEFEVKEDTETADCFRRPLIFLIKSCSFDVSSSYVMISIDRFLISSSYFLLFSCLGRCCTVDLEIGKISVNNFQFICWKTVQKFLKNNLMNILPHIQRCQTFFLAYIIIWHIHIQIFLE